MPAIATASPAVLALFPPEPDAELTEALAIVRKVPMDAWFVKQYTRCQKGCCRRGPSHGPYWRAKWVRDGKRESIYVGLEEALRKVLWAHERVRAHLLAQGIRTAEATKRPHRKVTSRPMLPREVRAELARADVVDERQGVLPIMEVRGAK